MRAWRAEQAVQPSILHDELQMLFMCEQVQIMEAKRTISLQLHLISWWGNGN